MNVKYENLVPTNQSLGICCDLFHQAEHLILYPHVHDELEMIYLLKGSLWVNIDDEIKILGKDDMVILNRLAPHEFKPYNINENLEYILLQFKPNNVFDNKKINIKFLEPFFHTNKFVYYIGNKDRESLGEIVDTLTSLCNHIKNPGFAYELIVQSELIKLLFLFHQNQIFSSAPQDINNRIKHVQRIANLQKYIDLHYAEDITVGLACELAQLDYHYFSRLFKQETGKTFVEYLNMIRLLKAENLLTSTNYSIAYIAESVGMSNVTYFNRVFKNHYGETPTVYRKRHGTVS